MTALGERVKFTVSAGNDEHTGQIWPAEFAYESNLRVTAVGSLESDGATRSCFRIMVPQCKPGLLERESSLTV